MQTYQIQGPWRGRLAIIPRPRGGEWLDDDVRALKEQGFDLVVSLLTADEATDLGLAQEENASKDHGLLFSNFPIPDLGVPDSWEKALTLLGDLNKALAAGKNLAIHCRQGIGRSGLLAVALLVVSGVEPETALRLVSAARGLTVPETLEQREWVVKLARQLAAPTIRG